MRLRVRCGWSRSSRAPEGRCPSAHFHRAVSYSQPFSLAIRTASALFRTASFWIAVDR
ncbi:hypothetical protein SAMN05428938_2081 [Streptomyces sp. KS_5]|nr:hypothetical protein SAMN05428938_2081 [Streptomyces sp. KS_5]SED12970.1 hypothetical protein SAMN05216482_6098 [Streptomyces sp. PAN_FS17]